MKENTVKTLHAIILMLAGLGCLKVAELTGRIDIKVNTLDISPAQASVIQNDLVYDTETTTPKRRGKR